MFLSFSKTIAKFGGFRIGIGTRVSKKNAGYALMFLFFYYLYKLFDNLQKQA